MSKKTEKRDLSKIISLKMTLGTRCKQFWRPCREIINKKPEHFHSMSTKDKKNSVENFFLTVFLWTLRLQLLYKPAESFLSEGQISYAELEKYWKKEVLFLRLFPLKMQLSPRKMQRKIFFPRQPKIFAQDPKKIEKL